MGMIMVRYPTKRDKRRQPFQPKCVCLVLNIKTNLQNSVQQHHALPGKVTDQIFGTVSPHYN